MTFKVLCDVHIAFKVVKFFQEKGHEAIHVNEILDGFYTKEEDISQYANENGYTVMTKDADFKNSHLLESSPSRLLKISLGNIPTKRLIEILNANLDAIVEHFQEEKCFIELGDGFMEVIN
jgi:predicted nuclease of predicted toxin-antitoxin system